MKLGLRLTAIITLVLSVGCAKQEPPAPLAQAPAPHLYPAQTYQGELAELYEQLKASPYAGECDKRLAEKRLEVARELEARRTEIAAFAKAHPAEPEADAPKVKAIKVGPAQFEQYIEEPETDGGWEIVSYGWTDELAQFEHLKNTPMSQDWVALDANIRSTAVMDENRLVHGLEMKTGHIEAMFESEKFHKNASIRRDAPDRLIVPLDSGPFAGAEAKLEELLASVWNAPELKIVIEWAAQATSPEIYKFLFHGDTAGRAFVWSENHSINLYPNELTRVIAHEFGHVLGFSDRYYTKFDVTTCDYTQSANPRDLMSGSRTGKPLPSDWDRLRESYPLTSVN